MIKKLIPTRSKKVNYPTSRYRKLILVDQNGLIQDGHTRYYSHLKFDTPLEIEELSLSDVREVPLEKLILTREERFFIYDKETWLNWNWERHPLLVTKDKRNGLYIVRLGNNRVYRLQENNYDYAKVRLIQ